MLHQFDLNRLSRIFRRTVRTAAVTATVGIFATMAPTDAEARSVCGKTIHVKYGETRARFKSTLATVRQDGSAHAVIYRLSKDAPLGWSHSLRIWRPHHNANWKLQFVAVERMADTSHPFQLYVDKSRPISFEKSHIQTAQSVNEYDLTTGTNHLEPVLNELRRGRVLEWHYVDQNGRDAIARFSLSGLTAANHWLACAADGE